MTIFERAIGILSLLWLVGVVISIGFSLFVAYTKLDEVLELMSKASLRAKRTPFWKGPKGRFMLTAEIAGIAVFPSSAIKAGTATLEEINSIPPPFKKMLTRMFLIDILLIILGVCTVIAGKYLQ